MQHTHNETRTTMNGWSIHKVKSYTGNRTATDCYFVCKGSHAAKVLPTKEEAELWAKENDPAEFRPRASTIEVRTQ